MAIERLNSPHSEQCAICAKHDAPFVAVRGNDFGEQDCPRCGRFKITGTGLAMARGLRDMRARTRLSNFVRRSNDSLVTIPQITSDDVRAVAAERDRSIAERAESLFAYIVSSSERLGAAHEISDPALDGAASSQVDDDNPGGFCSQETEWLLHMLEEKGWIREQDDDYEITPAGYAQWEGAQIARTRGQIAFIAMPFNQPHSDATRRGLTQGIAAAGYEPFVVDGEEHIGRIDDLIVSKLRVVRFVVCDLSYHRPNVYWEAGFSFGLGTPVFLTCHRDAVDQIHFDIRQYNAIVWATAEELAEKLQRRIEAVLGSGPIAP